MPRAKADQGSAASKLKGRQRGFGGIEKLPSGRLRVRWRDADGRRCRAPQTFATLADARSYLATVQADMLRGVYRAPKRVTQTLEAYGKDWVASRPQLKDSTRHQYAIDLRRHVLPYLGDRALDKIGADDVREWLSSLQGDLRKALSHDEVAKGGGFRDGRATAARAYRLLRAILQTAVDDEVIVRNPCRIPGAGDPKLPERPVLTPPEIVALAEAVPTRYRAFVVLAAYSGLRAGELAALRVRDVDVTGKAPHVRVSRRFYRVAGHLTIDTPKSSSGARVVPLPKFVAGEMQRHFADHREGSVADDLVFVTSGGRDVLDGYSQVIRRGLDRIGRSDARAHDLRHTAMTVAAEHGASLGTLMQMAGHSTAAAAQRYQHATNGHARRVAEAVDAFVATSLSTSSQ
jgi:integrase